MNKELKFRIWDIENKKFATVASILFTLKDNIYSIGDSQKDRFVVQLYSGLKDIDDNQIFEGDIIKSKYYDTIAGIIEYNEKIACFQVNGKTGGLLSCFNFGNSPFIVIGNIFENSNLIK